MELKIDIDTSEFSNFIEKYPATFIKTVAKEMKNQLVQIQRVSRKKNFEGKQIHRHHTRTGTLNDSIDWELSQGGLTGKVGFNVAMKGSRYGIFVHEGHGAPHKSVLKGYPYVWKPDRFLKHALEAREPYIQNDFETALRKVVDSL